MTELTLNPKMFNWLKIYLNLMLGLCIHQNRCEKIQRCVSLMNPLQWMGAVRMTVQTADKNITIIHKYSTPLQSIN